jgi:hypothetical protein
MVPQTPTSQICMISLRGALKAKDPQTFTISARPHPQGLPHWRYKHAQSLFCWASPLSLQRPAWSTQSHAPKACHAWDTHTHDLHSAGLCSPGLPRPAQYPLCKPVPLRPAKPGTHTHTISILLDRTPQACQAGDPQTHRVSTLPTCAFQACQTHFLEAHYFTSTHRPMGPHQLAIHHRKAPNLPKRNRQAWMLKN